MSGVNMNTIRNALALQIRTWLGVAGRETTVYEQSSPNSFPCVTIKPADKYINVFETSGSAGQADVFLIVRVHVQGRSDDTEIAMDNYLSIGSAEKSSIIDAIVSDKTLGGAVYSAVPLTVRGPRWTETEGYVAEIPVDIIVGKVGAQA